ncbi:hypothetical protein MNBD_UNCLBAC01-899 [hydrothermal vent metagenome]|uniref:Glycosyl transferase family 1 domain-containing protein n=1 Tax=hydrothermal vent metagenome TaxID=652676 RepID=A0A3B1D5A4_9ZZZZ
MKNESKKNNFIIGNCGDLKREEDQASLIKAVRKLIAKEINAELIFIGDGPLRENLIHLAQKFNIAKHIHFKHNKMTATELFEQCHVLVFSGFKVTNLELLKNAIAFKIPVIATKIESHRHLIEDGKTGFLVPCGFPERIEAALKRLEACHPEKRSDRRISY